MGNYRPRLRLRRNRADELTKPDPFANRSMGSLNLIPIINCGVVEKGEQESKKGNRQDPGIPAGHNGRREEEDKNRVNVVFTKLMVSSSAFSASIAGNGLHGLSPTICTHAIELLSPFISIHTQVSSARPCATSWPIDAGNTPALRLHPRRRPWGWRKQVVLHR
jgi:hypothetical protein